MRTILIAVIAIYTTAPLIVMPNFSADDVATEGSLIHAKADIKDAQGDLVGHATLSQTPRGVHIRLTLAGLPEGSHAYHIHEFGTCERPEFKTAGGHFNPEHKQHGSANPLGRHAGDLPNITVPASRRLIVDNVEPMVTLVNGAASLLDSDGSALVIHRMADDDRTDPSGDSGPPIACGVITRAIQPEL